MFEKIILRRSAKGPALSAGDVAESLLYYQNIHLVLDHNSLSNLVSQIGTNHLLSLLRRPNVSAVYVEETLGTRTDHIGSFDQHSFVAFTLTGNQEIGQFKNRKQRLEFIIQRLGYNKKAAAQFVEQFRRLASIRKLTDDYFLPGGVINAASQDLNDPDFVHEAIRHAITETSGSHPTPSAFKFDLVQQEGSFVVYTDLDFDVIKTGSRPVLNKPTVAQLTNEILMARADLALAAHYGGEFYTANVTSKIIQLRHGEILKRAGISNHELDQFHNIVLSECRTLREVIDSGERSFDDFLRLLDKSQKFRDWAQSVGPDEKLVSAYFKEVSAEGWIQKLPTKVLRYVLGSIVGAADALILEKILGSWRPSHFIDNRLGPFLHTDDN